MNHELGIDFQPLLEQVSLIIGKGQERNPPYIIKV